MTHDEIINIDMINLDIELRPFIAEILRNPDYMFDNHIRGLEDTDIDLIGVIVGMYEVIHWFIYNEEYDYMFHWANKCGSWVDTDYLFKLLKERGEHNENDHK